MSLYDKLDTQQEHFETARTRLTGDKTHVSLQRDTPKTQLTATQDDDTTILHYAGQNLVDNVRNLNLPRNSQNSGESMMRMLGQYALLTKGDAFSITESNTTLDDLHLLFTRQQYCWNKGTMDGFNDYWCSL